MRASVFAMKPSSPAGMNPFLIIDSNENMKTRSSAMGDHSILSAVPYFKHFRS